MARNNAAYPFLIFFQQNNRPFDVSGRSLKMQFKNTTGATPAGMATLQTLDGSITLNNPATSAVATIPYSMTQLMKQGTWYWDMLDVTNPLQPLPFGAGYLPMFQGITNSSTPDIPKPSLFVPGASMDSITVVAPGADAITLTFAPSGPPGSILIYVNDDSVPVPSMLPVIFYNSTDGNLKVIFPNGKIEEIATSS